MVLKSKEKVKIRASIVEGLFYPAAAEDLKLQIEQLMDKAPNAPAEAGLIITPHAALQYAPTWKNTAWKYNCPLFKHSSHMRILFLC